MGPTYEGECQICFELCKLQDRLCCGLPVCDNCMLLYLETQVNQRNLKIACINGTCSTFLYRDEVLGRLPDNLKKKFYKFLVDSNLDPKIKTCPRCSQIYNLDKQDGQHRGKYGLLVMCPECKLPWCFKCHAPWHSGVKCVEYKKGDKLLESWAKEHHYGSSNAQRCPKCKVFIQRNGGCDHMMCTQCNTNFCYRCGERYLSFRFLGDHNTRSSIFGCKYIYKPNKPHVRRAVRGSVFGLKVLGGLGLLGLGVAAAGVLLGASVVLLPAYGSYKLLKRRRIKHKQEFWQSQIQASFLEYQRQQVVHERFLNSARQPVDHSDGGIHVGIQTDQAEHVLVTVHSPDADNEATPTLIPDVPETSSEIQINIQDGRNNVILTTTDVAHTVTEASDSAEAPFTVHVLTTYTNRKPREALLSTDALSGDGGKENKEKEVQSESKALNMMTNDALSHLASSQMEGEMELASNSNTSTGGSKYDASVPKHPLLSSKTSSDTDKASKGDKVKKGLKKQTEEGSFHKKASSKKLDGNSGSLYRKRKKSSFSSDVNVQIHTALVAVEGKNEAVSENVEKIDGEDGPKAMEDLLPKDATHPQGCFLKLFSKNLKTLQHQFDKEKDKQGALTRVSLSDNRDKGILTKVSTSENHENDIDLLDCPDIVCCALESEMRNREKEVEKTYVRTDAEGEDIRRMGDVVPEIGHDVLFCTHF